MIVTSKRRKQTKRLRFRGVHPEVNNYARKARKNVKRTVQALKAIGNSAQRAGREFNKFMSAFSEKVAEKP